MSLLFRYSAPACAALLIACSAPQEPERISVPVSMGELSENPVTTDLGYAVTLEEARVMTRDFSFAIAGEAHASLLRRTYRWLVPEAHAHPGHYQGGDITGELTGRFLLDCFPTSPQELGVASLIVGRYTSANFHLESATESDLLDADDALLHHTALLRGNAVRDGETVSFSALIDAPDDRSIEGIPFEYSVSSDDPVEMQILLKLQDELGGGTLFDGLDFSALDRDGDQQLQLDPELELQEQIDAYHLLRRTLLSHDHYVIQLQPTDEPDSLEE